MRVRRGRADADDVRRWLAIWIAGMVLAGSAAAGARAGGDGDRTPLTVGGGAGTTTTSSTTTTTVAPTTTVPTTAAPSSTPRRSTSTTKAPSTPGLAVNTVTVDQSGAYVVRRDGSGLRQLMSGCAVDRYRTWAGSGAIVAMTELNGPATRISVQGASTPWTLPAITDRWGRTAPLRGIGSPSPDGSRTALTFGGDTEFGTALVDLAAQTTQVVVWGDNPAPSWSPKGEVLLTDGMGKTQLLAADGTVLRDWAQSPLGYHSPYLQWSPDGRRLVSTAGGMNMNQLLVYDPHTNTSQDLPQVGQGFNLVQWAGNDRLVLADAGTDHVVKPSLHLLDLGSGRLTDIAKAAWMPTVPVDGQIVAFEDRTDYRGIKVATMDGRRTADLVRVPDGFGIAPVSWSPDGTWLLFDACARPPRSGGSAGHLIRPGTS